MNSNEAYYNCYNHLVSIVLPTYNRSERLQNAIESCLRQSYKNIELIIVDDGSTDNTSQVAFAYIKQDFRVKYFYTTNQGLPAALNYGFNKAKGNYLTWTSDDNVYLSDAIEEMVKKAQEYSKPCLVYSDYCSYNEDTAEHNIVNLPSYNELNVQNHIGACFLYSKDVRNAIGDYNPDLFLVEDYDYWIRVSKKFDLVHISKPLYIFTTHNQSLSSERSFEIRALTLKLLEKYNFISSLGVLLRFINLLIKAFSSKRLSISEKIIIINKLEKIFFYNYT